MISLSSADSALKDYYLDAIRVQLNSDVSPFYNAIVKSSENVFGKTIKMSIVKSGMSAVRACNETEDLPSPSANRYFYLVQTLRNLYGTIEVSDKLIRASGDSSGAFLNILNAEMDGLISDAKANFARMLYGDGSGTLAYIKSKVSSYVLELESVKSFFAGMSVDVVTASGTMNVTINKVDKSANTITVSKSLDVLTVKAGEKIKVHAVDGKELTGLASIFDGEWLYGYKKESEPFFKPLVKSVEESALSADDIINIIDDLEEDCGHKPNIILCSHKNKRAIYKLFDTSRHIVNTTDIAAGCTSLYVNDVPVYSDKFCPDDRIYVLNTDDFILSQLCDWT
ncbi:MAG: phage major capsid protein, partial [Candidatus Coproplasma sp.]